MEKEKLKALIKRYEDVHIFALRQVSSIVAEKLPENMTMEQYNVLRSLKQRGKCRSSELADICGVNRSAITAMVDRLVAKDYVKRVQDEQDRRSIWLTTTSKGDEVYEQGEGAIEQMVASYLQELDDEEVEKFIHTYEKITTIIKRMQGEEQL